MMTTKELAVLRYLSQLLEANSRTIGEALAVAGMCDGHPPQAVAGGVCVNLRRRGWVTRVHDPKAWRITALGRVALAEHT